MLKVNARRPCDVPAVGFLVRVLLSAALILSGWPIETVGPALAAVVANWRHGLHGDRDTLVSAGLHAHGRVELNWRSGETSTATWSGDHWLGPGMLALRLSGPGQWLLVSRAANTRGTWRRIHRQIRFPRHDRPA